MKLKPFWLAFLFIKLKQRFTSAEIGFFFHINMSVCVMWSKMFNVYFAIVHMRYVSYNINPVIFLCCFYIYVLVIKVLMTPFFHRYLFHISEGWCPNSEFCGKLIFATNMSFLERCIGEVFSGKARGRVRTEPIAVAGSIPVLPGANIAAAQQHRPRAEQRIF